LYVGARSSALLHPDNAERPDQRMEAQSSTSHILLAITRQLEPRAQRIKNPFLHLQIAIFHYIASSKDPPHVAHIPTV